MTLKQYISDKKIDLIDLIFVSDDKDNSLWGAFNAFAFIDSLKAREIPNEFYNSIGDELILSFKSANTDDWLHLTENVEIFTDERGDLYIINNDEFGEPANFYLFARQKRSDYGI